MKPSGNRAHLSTTSSSSTVVAAIALLLALAACASSPRLLHKHEFALSPGQEYHSGLKTALLLPIDSTNEKPVKGLEFANDRITSLIVARLESNGLKVERVEPGKLQQAWTSARSAILAERKSGASGTVSARIELSDLVPEIVSKLENTSDLVIAPNIVMRGANYQGTRTIVWDGVRRRETVSDLHMTGSGIPAASMFVAVHTRDGARVFLGYGGLEPVFRIDRAAEKYVQREDLFKDERNLREGICIAFYPYFGMKEYCSR